MDRSMYSVSVIICAYTEERWYDLVAAVKSVQQQVFPPREIIVVIDHNPSLFKLVQTQFTGVVAIENKEMRGLSGARNSGIAVAQGEFVAFLDDDAVAEIDWLKCLVQYFDNKKVMGVGGLVEPRWMSGRPKWFPEEFYWVVGCSYLGLPQSLSVVRNPYGGCTCFRREVFEVVGGFRNGIGRVGSHPMGGEETELCIRARQHWPQNIFLYNPQARIYHSIPPHRATWRYFRQRCYAEGMSKALISRYVGAKESLSSEKIYIYKILFRGILYAIGDVFIHLDFTRLFRVGAILAGLLITIIGYLVGMCYSACGLDKAPNEGEMCVC